jgi:hypothetical protein
MSSIPNLQPGNFTFQASSCNTLAHLKVVMASLIVKTVAPSVRSGMKLAAGSTVARRFASSDKEIQHGTIDTDVYPADAVSGAPGQYILYTFADMVHVVLTLYTKIYSY